MLMLKKGRVRLLAEPFRAAIWLEGSMKSLRIMLLACAAATMVTGGQASAQTPGAAVTGGRTFNGDGPWTLGFDFTAGSSWTLTGLGVFDLDGDGLGRPHEIGLWDAAGTLLYSATVGAGTTGTLIDGFRYQALAPVTLGAGTYRIGAADLGVEDGYFLDGVVTMATGFTYNTAQYVASAGLVRPDQQGTNGGYFGANFLIGGAVPEPATWALLVLGFGAAGAGLRARTRRMARVTFA